jgi:hypothetical protein
MKAIQYFLGILVFLIGVSTILLEEPIYGIGLMVIGLLLTPSFSDFITKKAPHIFTKKVKNIAGGSIGLIIIISLATLGRKTYDKVENITADELKNLSIHPIKKTVVNALDYYYIEKGEGETLLLLHGFPDMANTWDEQSANCLKHIE